MIHQIVSKAIKADTLFLVTMCHKMPSLPSAILIALAAFINILPGVSDAFALITASSSGVYIAIYILIMVAHLKISQVTGLYGGWLSHAHYRFLNPLTMLFFAFVFVPLFTRVYICQEQSVQLSGLSVLVFIASGNLENRFETHQLRLVGFC